MGDYLTGDPLDLVKKGWLGPGTSPEAVYAKLIEIMQRGVQATSGYLGQAARRAGGQAPVDLQARLSAIQQQGINVANLNLATAMSSWEQTRASSALDRYMRYWAVEEQKKMAEKSAEAELWGAIGGGILGTLTAGLLGRKLW